MFSCQKIDTPAKVEDLHSSDFTKKSHKKTVLKAAKKTQFISEVQIAELIMLNLNRDQAVKIGIQKEPLKSEKTVVREWEEDEIDTVMIEEEEDMMIGEETIEEVVMMIGETAAEVMMTEEADEVRVPTEEARGVQALIEDDKN